MHINKILGVFCIFATITNFFAIKALLCFQYEIVTMFSQRQKIYYRTCVSGFAPIEINCGDQV